jgi:polyprenyl synthetase
MLIKAYEFLGKTPSQYWEKLLPLFTKTALEVCEGQQFDMDFETIDDICIEDYFEMIHLKTAVLLACALKMGAILADAPDDDQQTIYSLGIALGMAFQLKDDYLDTYGTTETLGKRVGDDILSYKKTFLLLTALHNADDTQKKRLVSAISAKDITDEQKIKTVTRIYNELDIPKICEKVIDEYYIQASNLLEKISVPSESKEPLKTLINKLKIRDK